MPALFGWEARLRAKDWQFRTMILTSQEAVSQVLSWPVILATCRGPEAGKDYLSPVGGVCEAGRGWWPAQCAHPRGRARPCTFVLSAPSSCQCAADPWESCLGRSPCDMEPNIALEAMVILASEKLWDSVPAWKWPGPPAGRPKLARTSKETWLSSVIRAVTPTERAPLLALVSQKRWAGWGVWVGVGPGFRMKLRPGFPSKRMASLGWLAALQSINSEAGGRGVAPFPRLYAFHISISKLTTSQPGLAHFP